MFPTSNPKYPTEARFEGCGLCSFPKRCESQEGRVLLSWRQLKKAAGLPNIAGILVYAG